MLTPKKAQTPARECTRAHSAQLSAQERKPQLQGMSAQAQGSAASMPYFDAASAQLQQAQWHQAAQPSAAAMANLGVMPARPMALGAPAHIKIEAKSRPPGTAQRPVGRSPGVGRPFVQGPPPLDLIGHLQRQCGPLSHAVLPSPNH